MSLKKYLIDLKSEKEAYAKKSKELQEQNEILTH